MHARDPRTLAPVEREIVLQPGEYFVGAAGPRVRTLLGSCVSITLWHPRLRVGAMSHYLLASRPGPRESADARYGDEALWIMARELGRLGAPLRECEAKIFGGGDMFPGVATMDANNVGLRNGTAAYRMLESRHVPVVATSLFGVGHRVVIFDVESGDAWVHLSDSTSPAPMTGRDA